jgi:cobalt-zinc-cadmium efflux system outer membrane protein
VGVKPNPTIGYFGSQIADAGTDQHGAFVSQEIVTGGKLAQNRRVLDRSLQAQLWDFETQKQRVLTDVRVQFYEALAAQRRIELSDQFHEVTAKGVEVSRRRREAQETSVVDLLQAEVQMAEIDVARQQARVALRGAVQQLAAVVGTGELPQQSLSGELRQDSVEQDWDAVLQKMLQSSPELQAARFRISAAQALQQRQQMQTIPNLQTELGAGADNATGSGLINVTVGLPVPVFNRNSGNISAAYAEYSRAVHEVSRIEASIKSRLAEARRDYDTAAVAVRQYEGEILPRAAQTLELSEKAFAAGEFDFLQVLIVRRTYFEANLKYVDSLAALAQARARIDGLLLTGGLDAPADFDGDDSLRGQTFSQQ